MTQKDLEQLAQAHNDLTAILIKRLKVIHDLLAKHDVMLKHVCDFLATQDLEKMKKLPKAWQALTENIKTEIH